MNITIKHIYNQLLLAPNFSPNLFLRTDPEMREFLSIKFPRELDIEQLQIIEIEELFLAFLSILIFEEAFRARRQFDYNRKEET